MSRTLRRTGEHTAMIRLNFCRPQTIPTSLSILGAAVLFATLGEFAAGGDEPPADVPACRLGAVDASCHFIRDEEKEEEPEQFETRLFVAEADGSKMRPLADLPEYQAQGSPNWSRDGKYIVFDAWKPQ